MSDFDTRRIGEIMVLEEQVSSLQSNLKMAQLAATKWEPQVSVLMDPGTGARVTMAFGGRTLGVLIPMVNLTGGDPTSLTTSVLEAFCKNLIIDQLRPVIQPQVERLMTNAVSLTNTGSL